jgi:hypothetical protein
MLPNLDLPQGNFLSEKREGEGGERKKKDREKEKDG